MFGKQYWKIQGYVGADKTFEKLLPEGSLGESETVVLLQRLLARHLDEAAIVSSSLRHSAPGYTPHLEPQIGHDDHHTIRVGSDPYYVAGVWARDEISQ